MTRAEVLKNILGQSQRGEIPPIRTVKQLALLAGISRVSLYKYYPEVILALRAGNGSDTTIVMSNVTKSQLLKARYTKVKQELDSLAGEYIQVLLKLEEMKAAHEDAISSADYRIRLLEEKLSRHERPGPRSVK